MHIVSRRAEEREGVAAPVSAKPQIQNACLFFPLTRAFALHCVLQREKGEAGKVAPRLNKHEAPPIFCTYSDTGARRPEPGES